MKLIKPPQDLEGFYTPFWPVLIVFIALIVLMVYEISVLRYRRLVLIEQNNHMAEYVNKAKVQNDFIEGLHKDLDSLATTDANAARIEKDFFPPDTTTAPAPK